MVKYLCERNLLKFDRTNMNTISYQLIVTSSDIKAETNHVSAFFM
jgi:hypothetical protein